MRTILAVVAILLVVGGTAQASEKEKRVREREPANNRESEILRLLLNFMYKCFTSFHLTVQDSSSQLEVVLSQTA